MQSLEMETFEHFYRIQKELLEQIEPNSDFRDQLLNRHLRLLDDKTLKKIQLFIHEI